MPNIKVEMSEVVAALEYLEASQGRTPSVKDIADYLDVSTATALRYLDDAAEQKKIVKRGGKFMTHAVAEAYGQKEG